MIKMENENHNLSRGSSDRMGNKSEQKEERESKRRNEKDLILELRKLDIDDIKCGVGRCKPQWLQGCASKNIYLIVYCFAGLCVGMYFTYSVATISTIEKRFKMTSKHTGIMLSGNDISQVFIAIIVSYFGNYGNRPLLMACGIWSASLACALSALPHAIYGPGEEAIMVQHEHHFNSNLTLSSNSLILNMTSNHSSKKVDLCYDALQENCENVVAGESATEIGPIVIFFISQLLIGITIALFYSIGMVYLDDNVEKKQSPLYYTVTMIVRVVGPVLGYFLGSKCLSIYVIPDIQPNLSLRDPRWLGAWWIGYLLLSCLLFACGTLLALFPRKLPTTLLKNLHKVHHEESLKAKEDKMLTNGLELYEERLKEPPAKRDFRLSYCEGDFYELNKSSDLKKYLKMEKENERFTKPALAKLPAALKRLLSNKVFLGNNFSTVLVLFALMAYWNFKPKYLEFQFGKSASIANLYTGIASLTASILGLATGGIVVKILKPNPRQVTGYAIFLTWFGSACMFCLMFIGCPQININGPTNWRIENSTSASCMSDCGCSERYAPVCSQDGDTTFYSACYAGCTIVDSTTSPVDQDGKRES